MQTVKKVFYNTGALLIGRFYAKAISLIVVILIARYLGTASYGIYSFAFAFISFFTIISELGLERILVRELSRDSGMGNFILGNAILLKCVLSTIAFILAIVVISLLNYPLETVDAVKLVALILLVDVFNFYGTIYESALQMKYAVSFNVFSRTIYLIMIYSITFYDLGLNALILSNILATALQNILMAIHSKTILIPSYKLKYDVLKMLLIESLPLAISAAFTIIYYRIDVVMLSMMDGDLAVGLYSAAYRFSESFLIIPSIVMMSIFPLLSKHSNNSKNTSLLTSIYIFEKTQKYLFSVGIFLGINVYFLSSKIILLIYGDSFYGSIQALQILIWSIVLIFLNSANGNLFVSRNMQKLVACYTAIGVISNITLNYVLIPLYSYSGAAIATVLTELIIMIVSFSYLPSDISKKKILSNNRASLFAGFITILFLVSGIVEYLGLLSLIFSSTVYFFFFILFNGLDEDDIKVFLSVFDK